MKKLIHRYLDTYYFVGYVKLDYLGGKGFYFIFKVENNNQSSFREVQMDCVNVFGLTPKQTKWYIKSWYLRTANGEKFDNFWMCDTQIIYNAQYRKWLSDKFSAALEVEVKPFIKKSRRNNWNCLCDNNIKYSLDLMKDGERMLMEIDHNDDTKQFQIEMITAEILDRKERIELCKKLRYRDEETHS